jgi:hypothetical protein
MMRSFNRNVMWPLVWLAVPAALPLAGCAPSAAPDATEITTQPSAPAKPAAGAPSTADFEAIIYRTHVPAAGILRLDVADLTAKAARGEDLQKELAKLGRTQALYRASQAISLTTENHIRVGTKKPFVTGSRAVPGGRTIRTVQYQDVGAIFRLAAEPITKRPVKQMRVRLEVELSDMDQSDVEVGPGVKAVTVRSAAFSYNGAVPVGKPFVMTAVDASSDARDANAAAYVCRVVLSSLR